MAPVRNVLPQSLGYSPGTYLIGNFGSTEPRFRTIPLDKSPEPLNPGPAHYGRELPLEKQQRFKVTPKYSWGKSPAHARVELPQNPGPGAHETYKESATLDELQKRWPGVPSASAFSANAARPDACHGRDASEPGPGQYESVSASFFVSSASGARSPFIAEARRGTGSRLRRAVDTTPSAQFLSRTPARRIFAHPGGASTGGAVEPNVPGPGAYTPGGGFDEPPPRERSLDEVARLANLRAFDGSEPRFGRLAGEPTPTPENPGPGAHSVQRWDGVKVSTRRPRLAPGARDTGFNSRSVRQPMGGTARPSDTEVGLAVVDYLANGPLGPPGSGAHKVLAAMVVPRSST